MWSRDLCAYMHEVVNPNICYILGVLKTTILMLLEVGGNIFPTL